MKSVVSYLHNKRYVVKLLTKEEELTQKLSEAAKNWECDNAESIKNLQNAADKLWDFLTKEKNETPN